MSGKPVPESLTDRPLPSSFDENEDFYNANPFQKIARKIKREPLIPLGCLLTVAAFTSAYRAMRRGDHQQVQRMFRARVLAQSFTVVAMVAGGVYFGQERRQERDAWKVQQRQKEEDQKARWIRELEARDEEEKALIDRLERRKKRAAERDAAREAGAPGTEVAGKAQVGTEVLSVEKKEGTSVLGSLGGLFGGGSKSGDAQRKSDADAEK
ncbi:uncharacterized protein E0L32_004601 [Thyridium curvatum]|uniref:HIG1 domain-containing protein n=1 Tax=Thyridium curvatum TaxID=1093900 RepID=A0A507B9N0_9PEZI|nr:uncharacterized protein E0L32_004601 [Thyridium curvatum]TPX15324.1 hypothetical protein E0L32_004601 [Thyridium curvatum]